MPKKCWKTLKSVYNCLFSSIKRVKTGFQKFAVGGHVRVGGLSRGALWSLVVLWQIMYPGRVFGALLPASFGSFYTIIIFLFLFSNLFLQIIIALPLDLLPPCLRSGCPGYRQPLSTFASSTANAPSSRFWYLVVYICFSSPVLNLNIYVSCSTDRCW